MAADGRSIENLRGSGDTSGVFGARNLFWRWVAVAGFAVMITALAVQSPWVFLAGLALLGVGVVSASRVTARYPQEARKTGRKREVGLVWWPVFLVASFGWLLADTRAALLERRTHTA